MSNNYFDLTRFGVSGLGPNADESYLHLSGRAVQASLISMLEEYLAKSSTFLPELPKLANEKSAARQAANCGVLHEDGFTSARVMHLPAGYEVTFAGTGRDGDDSASTIYLLSGNVRWDTVDDHDRQKTIEHTIAATERFSFTDRQTQRITTTEDTTVIQVVSPRRRHGRSLLLPALPPTTPIREVYTSPPRYWAKLVRNVWTRPDRVVALAFGPWLPMMPSRPAGPGADLRMMAVHAHPDDESSKGAATSAMYASEGVDVLVITCTGGEEGSVLNPAHEDQVDEFEARKAEIRAAEMARAREILGVRQCRLGLTEDGKIAKHHRTDASWRPYADSGMDDGSRPAPAALALRGEEATSDLVREIRAQRPQVITTYDESGGYAHPDHIATHRITMAAVSGANNIEKYPEGEFGKQWSVDKVYYQRPFHSKTVRMLDEHLNMSGNDSYFKRRLALWEIDPGQDPLNRVTTSIPCGRYFEVANKALEAHSSQAGNSIWLSVPLPVRIVMWPYEDFERVYPAPDPSAPREVELDLFAGIREKAAAEHKERRKAKRSAKHQPRSASQLPGTLRGKLGGLRAPRAPHREPSDHNRRKGRS